MTSLGFIFFFLVLLVFSVWSHLEFYKYGYKKGRKDADGWWMSVEEQADQERMKIWRGGDVTINDKAKAALQQPGTQAVTIEMTPELRGKYQRIAGELIALLKANTQGPVEAYMILTFVMESLEESCGIRGGFSIGHERPQS